MKLIIEIDMDNAAFNRDAGGWEQEATRILMRLTELEFVDLDRIGDQEPLIDVNGNKVGTAELRRRRTWRAKR